LENSLNSFNVPRNLFYPGTERLKSYAKRKAHFTMLEAHQWPCTESRLTLNIFPSRCFNFIPFLSLSLNNGP